MGGASRSRSPSAVALTVSSEHGHLVGRRHDRPLDRHRSSVAVTAARFGPDHGDDDRGGARSGRSACGGDRFTVAASIALNEITRHRLGHDRGHRRSPRRARSPCRPRRPSTSSRPRSVSPSPWRPRRAAWPGPSACRVRRRRPRSTTRSPPAIIGSTVTASAVSLSATDTSSIVSTPVAASLSVAVGQGAVAVSIGAAVAINEVGNTIRAAVVDSTISATGAVSVTASQAATITATATSASIAVSVGLSAISISVAGALTLSQNTVGFDGDGDHRPVDRHGRRRCRVGVRHGPHHGHDGGGGDRGLGRRRGAAVAIALSASIAFNRSPTPCGRRSRTPPSPPPVPSP